MNALTSESPDSVIDAVLSASRVLVAVAARSLSDIAEEVTLTQYRTLVVDRRIWSGWPRRSG
jgi:hypothetical protein